MNKTKNIPISCTYELTLFSSPLCQRPKQFSFPPLSFFLYSLLYYFSSKAPTIQLLLHFTTWALDLPSASNTSFPSCAFALLHTNWSIYSDYKYGAICNHLYGSLLPCLPVLWWRISFINCASPNPSGQSWGEGNSQIPKALGIYGESFQGIKTSNFFKICIMFRTIFHF